MIYLLLAIISSSLISILMRTSEKYSQNNITMLAFNYLMCTVMAAFYTGSINLIPSREGIGFSLISGLISGALYLVSFMLLKWNVHKNGVAMSATFMKLGVIVPTLLAVVIFGEMPRPVQIIGVLIALAAIFLIQYSKTGEKSRSGIGLILLLLGGGITDTMAKVYDHWGSAALESHYLFYTFFVALVLCTILAAVKKQSVKPADILFGMLIGIPNYFSAKFLLGALSAIPAVVAYPSYSAGTIITVTLAGVIFFKEKLSRRRIVAIGLILCALVLLNI